jgi:hypothetical protein
MADPTPPVDPTTASGILAVVGAIFTSIKYFASSSDLDKLENKINDRFVTKEDASEKFVTKDAIKAVMDELHYIRERLDQLVDKKN